MTMKTKAVNETHLTPREKKAVVAKRLDTAKERLTAARIMLKGKSPRSAIPFAYFAILAAMNALLPPKGNNVKNRRNTFASFNNRYVKAGLFSYTLMVHAETVEKFRELADYYELAPISKRQARYTVKAAAKFVRAVEKFMKESERAKRNKDGK